MKETICYLCGKQDLFVCAQRQTLFDKVSVCIQMDRPGDGMVAVQGVPEVLHPCGYFAFQFLIHLFPVIGM